MLWGLYLLIVAGVFSSITSFYLFRETERYKFLCLFFASAFFFSINVGKVIQYIATESLFSTVLSWFIQWGSICCIALVLCSLLFFLRELKPKSVQLHASYSLIPLLVILSYFLVYNSNILKTWLLIIYEGSAVIVGVTLHLRYYLRHNIFRTAFIGCLLFLISFALYLFLPKSMALIWRSVLTAGIFTIFSGYLIVNNYSLGKVKKSYKISI